MTMDLNTLVAIVGWSALGVFWLMHLKSGWSGLLLVCVDAP